MVADGIHTQFDLFRNLHKEQHVFCFVFPLITQSQGDQFSNKSTVIQSGGKLKKKKIGICIINCIISVPYLLSVFFVKGSVLGIVGGARKIKYYKINSIQ